MLVRHGYVVPSKMTNRETVHCQSKTAPKGIFSRLLICSNIDDRRRGIARTQLHAIFPFYCIEASIMLDKRKGVRLEAPAPVR